MFDQLRCVNKPEWFKKSTCNSGTVKIGVLEENAVPSVALFFGMSGGISQK